MLTLIPPLSLSSTEKTRISTGKMPAVAAAAAKSDGGSDIHQEDLKLGRGSTFEMPGFFVAWEDENGKRRYSLSLQAPGGATAKSFSTKISDDGMVLTITYHMPSSIADVA